MNDEYWRDDALCKDSNPKHWFPTDVGNSAAARLAKMICAQCPVSEPCLQYALDNDQRYGIWGGMSEKERRLLGRDRGIRR